MSGRCPRSPALSQAGAVPSWPRDGGGAPLPLFEAGGWVSLSGRDGWLILFIYLSFVFLGLHLQHLVVPRLGVLSELQLPAYTTATAMWDPRHICDLHHSSRQCRILNPLSEARDGTRNLMVPSLS